MCIRDRRHHGAAFQQLALTIGQQGTAGAAGLLGTLGQTLRVEDVYKRQPISPLKVLRKR